MPTLMRSQGLKPKSSSPRFLRKRARRKGGRLRPRAHRREERLRKLVKGQISAVSLRAGTTRRLVVDLGSSSCNKRLQSSASAAEMTLNLRQTRPVYWNSISNVILHKHNVTLQVAFIIAISPLTARSTCSITPTAPATSSHVSSSTVTLLVSRSCTGTTKLLGLAAPVVRYQECPVVLHQGLLQLILRKLIDIPMLVNIIDIFTLDIEY